MSGTESQSGAGTAPGGSTSPKRGLASTLVWVLPAATFVIGLVIGFAVWGTGGNDESSGQAEGTPSVSAAPSSGQEGGQTVTVAVPQSCLDAVDESQASLDLFDQAAQAIGDLDAARLQDIVDELQGASERIQSLGQECRDATDVTISSGSAPTS